MRFLLLLLCVFLFSELSAQNTLLISDSLVIEKDAAYSNTSFACSADAIVIIKANATLTIDRCKFYSTETCLWKGIEVRENAKLVLRYSHIQEAQHAVHVYGGGWATVIGNTFNCNFVPVVYKAGSSLHARANNTQANTFNYPRGFTLQNTDGNNTNFLYCNTAFSNYTGYRVEGDCSNTDFMGNNIGQSNPTNSNYIGLHITNMNSEMGAQFDKANKWYSTYTGINSNWAAWNEMPTTINDPVTGLPLPNPGPFQFSQFRMPFSQSTTPTNTTGNLPIFPANGSNPPGVNWFLNGPVVSDPCPNLPAPPANMFMISGNGWRTLNSFEQSVVSEEYTPAYFAAVNKWEAKRSVYSRLYDGLEKGVTLDSIEQAFYNHQQNTVISQLSEVEKTLRDTSAYTIELLENIAATSAIADSLYQLLTEIDSALQYATGQDSIDLETQSDTLFAALMAVHTETDSMNYIADSLYRAKAAAARELNSYISTTETWEADHKTVNDIYLRTITQRTPLTGTELETLTTIAERCYLQYGKAVLNARSMIGAYDTRSFDQYDNCIGGSSKRDEWEEQPSTVSRQPSDTIYRLFPNPANQSVTVEKTDVAFNDEEIAIIDGQGRVIAVYSNNAKLNIVQLNVRYLAAGSYHCRISVKGKSVSVLPLKIMR